MAKVALLVGVSTCEVGLPPLLRARTNVEVLKRALQGTNSGFEVEILHDPALPSVAEAIEVFFRHRDQDDQILFLISGYGFKDTDGQLYFAAPTTALDDRGNLVRARTLPASFVQNVMDSSPAWRQVVIFDCCFQLTPGIPVNPETRSMEDALDRLIGDRRVILSASTHTQHEAEPENLDAWSYTRYLAEGAVTGAADRDYDGSLSVKELHFYAQRKLKVAAPLQRPQFYGSDETANQLVLQVPSQTPEVQYRQFLETKFEKILAKGTEKSEIDRTEFRFLEGRNTLNALWTELGLSPAEAADIESHVLRPVREHQQRLQLFQEISSKLIERTE